MHILIKLHKTPIKSRTIISSKFCITKPISKTVQLCLSAIQKSRMIYCNNFKNMTGINTFWIIESNRPILDTISQINKEQKAKSITTYDFANMYTNIDHDSLINEISSIVSVTLKDKYGLKIIGNKAIICHIDSSDFGATDLIKMIEFVVRNTYFTMGDSLYKQVHGIPMGTDCAPQLANLFLHSLEHKYVMQSIKKKPNQIHKIKHIFRFIDDLTVINGGDVLDTIKHDIYPPYLNLLRVNNSTDAADVLDLNINKENHKFSISFIIRQTPKSSF